MEEINYENYFNKDITEVYKIEEFLDNLKLNQNKEEFLNKLIYIILYYHLLFAKNIIYKKIKLKKKLYSV